MTRSTRISRSADETRKLGKQYAKGLKLNDVVALFGELGTGKTQLIKGICDGLGVKQVVNSPTFIIVNEYSSNKMQFIYHFDFYRMKTRDEILDIGFKEYLDSGGLLLIEWPELIENDLPENAKKIFLNFHSSSKNSREITLNAIKS
jgi:tRNA threonylcarbamoyladenosine biosynthesis protein TsaE